MTFFSTHFSFFVTLGSAYSSLCSGICLVMSKETILDLGMKTGLTDCKATQHLVYYLSSCLLLFLYKGIRTILLFQLIALVSLTEKKHLIKKMD